MASAPRNARADLAFSTTKSRMLQIVASAADFAGCLLPLRSLKQPTGWQTWVKRLYLLVPAVKKALTSIP